MPHAIVFGLPYLTIYEQNGAAERAAARESPHDLLFVATLLFVTSFEPSNKEPPLTKRPPKLIGSNSFDRSAPPVYEKGSMPEVPRTYSRSRSSVCFVNYFIHLLTHTASFHDPPT